MDNKVRAQKLLGSYLRWPIIIALIMIVMTGTVMLFDKKSAVVVAVFTLFSISLLIFIYTSSQNMILGSLIKFSMESNNSMMSLYKEMSIPYMIFSGDMSILWKNKALEERMSTLPKLQNSVTAVFPDFNLNEILAGYGKDYYKLGERKYRVDVKETEFENEKVFVAYLYDNTDLIDAKKEVEENKAVVGVVYLDNYEEVMENIEEVRRSLLEALVDRRINQYFLRYDAIVKKLEKDRYVFFVQNSNLLKMEEVKFDILEEVKGVSIGNDMSMTLSIGVGVGADEYTQNYEYARQAIDMALGRGGDQAVVKTGETLRYFGGKSKTIEKNTRVKARVKAHALRELMASKDRVIIMGHKNMDIDVLGSSVGIWRIATFFNKKAHIAVGNINASLKPLVEMFHNGEYPEDMFLTGDKLKPLIDDNTMLVVVDVNRPSITEVPELLQKINTIVVLDHHRQSSEIIDNATLSYVEPFASSACEMVAEIVQYISDDIKLKQAEADAMYAGIVIDTLNFTNQTGVRTFEAAVFLKRKGADITRVRKLFRDKLDNYRAKAKIIEATKVYMDSYAISVCEAAKVESPTVVGAQAANALLDIVGIKASFVITPYNDIIYISARSIDEVNVQLVMEKLGGGGHRTVAGAQLKDISVEEALGRLEAVIKDMIEKGDV
jgi:DHH subfamily 1 protein